MTPKLIVIAGAPEGTTFPLSEAEVTIGRDFDNVICLPDRSVSRHHCIIKKDGDHSRLSDLESRNSTYVNGIPVRQHVLRNGDHIRVGDTLFLYLLEEAGQLSEGIQVRLDETDLIATETMLLRKDALVEFETTEDQFTAVSRSTRDLNALLKISLAVNSLHNVESFGRQLLPLIFEVIPASRGAILIIEQDTGEYSLVYGRHRSGGITDPIRVSRTATERVVREGEPILSNDVLQDLMIRDASSLAIDPIQALLVVPIALAGRVLGVIYLDSPDPGVRFDEDHLQLMRAIAAVSAVALENIDRMARLESDNRRLQAEIAIEHDMVGDSPRMQEVYQFIAKVAPTNSTVLIRGESGTGKELAARAIHNNSVRAGKPFVAINCAALTETLLESELFGHEKGAFTGAVATKKGKLEVAEGGTVFLDELGEMDLTLQSKLLRVLQNHEFERVGGTRTIKADIRLIAATNRNLEQAIRDGRFREDLYYRLNVLRLNLPSLRERREDILPLARFFISKYSHQCNRQIRGLTPRALACLQQYDWPGNVREFENAIERAIVLGTTDEIQIDDLPEDLTETISSSESATRNFYEAVNEAKKRLIIEAFNLAEGNYTEAAKLLEIHPNHLHRLIRNLGMKEDLKR
ncbi:MAG: sigma 54-interacting transcriptional regulator [Acidobacteriota bacterium]|nr:MAG: sigma 54-interacting transcriptional regulator [Acidobacteriota bacterium]